MAEDSRVADLRRRIDRMKEDDAMTEERQAADDAGTPTLALMDRAQTAGRTTG